LWSPKVRECSRVIVFTSPFLVFTSPHPFDIIGVSVPPKDDGKKVTRRSPMELFAQLRLRNDFKRIELFSLSLWYRRRLVVRYCGSLLVPRMRWIEWIAKLIAARRMASQFLQPLRTIVTVLAQ
jgi:hypothetical protein